MQPSGPDDDMQMARGYVQQASAFSASKRNSRQCQLDDGMPVVANHRLRSSPAAETGKPDRRHCRACLLLEKYIYNTLSTLSDISRSILNAKFVILGWLRRASSSLKYNMSRALLSSLQNYMEGMCCSGDQTVASLAAVACGSIPY